MKLFAILELPMVIGAVVKELDRIEKENPGANCFVSQFEGSTLVYDREFSIALKCWCRSCGFQTSELMEKMGKRHYSMGMIACPDCGSKRCSRANSHGNICVELS